MTFQEVEAEQAWSVFDEIARTQLIYLLGRRMQLTPGLLETACLQVATELAETGDPEYIRATVPPIPTVPDETRISTLIAQRILGEPKVPYSMHAMDVVAAQGGFAENIDTRGSLPMDFGNRMVVVARPDVCTRFMAGAAASIRLKHQYRDGGPIIVAVGDTNFITSMNSVLRDGDVTIDTYGRDDRVPQVDHMLEDFVPAGADTCILVQHAQVAPDIMDRLDGRIAYVGGVSPERFKRPLYAYHPLGNIVAGATQTLYGFMPVDTLCFAGVERKNAETILSFLTPSMVFDGKTFSRYFPLWRNDE